MGYRQNIDQQLKMLDVTWESLTKHGVTSETKLVLVFSYKSQSKQSALSLNAALVNYEMSVRVEGFLRKRWFVEGKSNPTQISKAALAQWLDYMVALGWEYESEFVGFGASIGH